MHEAPKYVPVAPPEAERRWWELKQALCLPKTLRWICRIIREDFEPGALDEYLWSFWGFHHEPDDLRHRARPWQKVELRAIEPGHVTGIAVWEMALMLNMAMEDEEPIPAYPRQSGEGFRFLLPTLGRARETAKTTQCLSNIKQLSLAQINYLNVMIGFLSCR